MEYCTPKKHTQAQRRPAEAAATATTQTWEYIHEGLVMIMGEGVCEMDGDVETDAVKDTVGVCDGVGVAEGSSSHCVLNGKLPELELKVQNM